MTLYVFSLDHYQYINISFINKTAAEVCVDNSFNNTYFLVTVTYLINFYYVPIYGVVRRRQLKMKIRPIGTQGFVN